MVNKDKVREIIIEECPSCKSIAAFLYSGIQDGGELENFVLYNCFECGTTISEMGISASELRRGAEQQMEIYCPFCRQQSLFMYMGIKKDFDRKDGFYRCMDCMGDVFVE